MNKSAELIRLGFETGEFVEIAARNRGVEFYYIEKGKDRKGKFCKTFTEALQNTVVYPNNLKITEIQVFSEFESKWEL